MIKVDGVQMTDKGAIKLTVRLPESDVPTQRCAAGSSMVMVMRRLEFATLTANPRCLPCR